MADFSNCSNFHYHREGRAKLALIWKGQKFCLADPSIPFGELNLLEYTHCRNPSVALRKLSIRTWVLWIIPKNFRTVCKLFASQEYFKFLKNLSGYTILYPCREVRLNAPKLQQSITVSSASDTNNSQRDTNNSQQHLQRKTDTSCSKCSWSWQHYLQLRIPCRHTHLGVMVSKMWWSRWRLTSTSRAPSCSGWQSTHSFLNLFVTASTFTSFGTTSCSYTVAVSPIFVRFNKIGVHDITL